MMYTKSKVFFLILILSLCFLVNGCKVPSKVEKILNGGRLTVSEIKENIVPFQLKDNLIYIKVRINRSEKEFNFLLDTGAGVTVINKRVADALDLRKKAEINAIDIMGNSQSVDVIALKSLSIGDMTVKDCGAIIINFENVGGNFDGVIGTNFLYRFLVDINYENTNITFSTDQNYLKNLTLSKEIPYTYSSGGRLIMKLKLAEDTLFDAAIDTGSSSDCLQIPQKFLEQFKPYLNSKLIKSKGIMSYGAFSGSSVIISRVNEVRIDDNQVSNLPVAFIDTDYINIPNKILSHFNVIIDYPKAKMFFIRNEDKPFETNISTFGFSAQTGADEKKYITGILEDSPAEKNGLQVGDQIIRETYEESDTVHLVIKNENGEKEIVFKSAMLLPEI